MKAKLKEDAKPADDTTTATEFVQFTNGLAFLEKVGAIEVVAVPSEAMPA